MKNIIGISLIMLSLVIVIGEIKLIVYLTTLAPAHTQYTGLIKLAIGAVGVYFTAGLALALTILSVIAGLGILVNK